MLHLPSHSSRSITAARSFKQNRDATLLHLQENIPVFFFPKYICSVFFKYFRKSSVVPILSIRHREHDRIETCMRRCQKFLENPGNFFCILSENTTSVRSEEHTSELQSL